jgi:hypothetical protein
MGCAVTVQTEQNLYLLMDFAAGGELFRLIREMHHLPELDAKFYASEAAPSNRPTSSRSHPSRPWPHVTTADYASRQHPTMMPVQFFGATRCCTRVCGCTGR